MSFLHLFIVNKSGGLIHHRPLTEKAAKVVQIGTNEWLRVASTFHSLHAIAAEASPVRLASGKNACEFMYVAVFQQQHIRKRAIRKSALFLSWRVCKDVNESVCSMAPNCHLTLTDNLLFSIMQMVLMMALKRFEQRDWS